MTIVELMLYALVAGIVLAFFIMFFSRTRRVHDRQSLEVVYQGSFTKLCEQLEKDLAGCRSWKVRSAGEATASLAIARGEKGLITYDVQYDTGEIVRNATGLSTDPLNGERAGIGEAKNPSASNISLFTFRGEQQGVLKVLEFTAPATTSNILELKIELQATPAIVFTHVFSIRVSNGAHESSGYFEEPKFEDVEPTVVNPTPQPPQVPQPPQAPSGPTSRCPMDGLPQREMPKRPRTN